ncbi:MAG: tetratricopeptide repeat protein [Planctomycetota bacterium]
MGKAEQALQHDSNLSKAQLLRANALLEMGRPDEATAYLEHVLETDPESWVAHYALAEVYDQDPDKSRYHQQRVLALCPDTAEAYYASSIVATDEEAIGWLTKALARNSMHYESRVRRAMYYIRSGRWDEALSDAEMAIRIRPGDYQGWWWKGEALLRHRKYAAALQMFDEATGLKPAARIYYARATIHRRLGEYPKAIENYNQALKISPANPNSPWILYHRATVQWILGDHQAALEDYDRFSALHPAPFWTPARRFFILQEQNRVEEARQHLQQAYARISQADWLAQVFEYLLQRRSPESLLALADTDAKRCEANYYIAECRFQGGDVEGARQFYESCLATGIDRYVIPEEVTPSSEYELSEWRLTGLSAGR